MTVDYAALRANKPERFEAGSWAWHDLARSFDQRIETHQQQVVDPVHDGSWQGGAAKAGRAAVKDDHDELVATAKYFRTVVEVLSAAGKGARQAHARCDEGVRVAGGLPIDKDGNVNLDFAAKPVPWDNPPILAAMRAQSIINQALHMANVVDDDLAPLLKLATRFADGGYRTDGDRDLAEVVDTCTDTVAKLALIPQVEPVHDDTDPQPYHDQQPTPEDEALKAAFVDVAVPYFHLKGWHHAAALFAHWLLNTGNTAYVDPEEMMNDIPSFRQTVAAAVTRGPDGYFDTGWHNTSTQDGGGHTQSLDWWYAMNDFRYRVVGRSHSTGGTKQVHYTVGVLKPYVFGPPRDPVPIPILSKIVPGAQVDQESIAHLHRAGFARNFIIQGIRHYSA